MLGSSTAIGAVSTSAAPARTNEPGSYSTPASSAFGFLDSVGVNVHTTYTDTGYANAPAVLNLLTRLGVRHVRDGLNLWRADQINALNLFAARGITSDLILGRPSSSSAGQTFDPAYLQEMDTALRGDVVSVEGPNEYDCSGDPNWATNLRAYDTSMYAAVRSDPALAWVPVLGPSFCREPNASAYGPLTGTADVANLHTYPSGLLPETSSEDAIRAAQSASDENRLVISETGYHNALHRTSGQLPATQATAADYVTRQVLDDFASGAGRTYLYELLDEHPNGALDNPEQHFGLVNADGTVKPAFHALANLLHDVARGNPMSVTATTSTSAPAPLQIQGGGALMRHVVMADPSGGGYTVALWLAEPLANPSTIQPLANRQTKIRLNLGDSYVGTLQRPSRGNAAIALGTGTHFDVPVGGTVSLVHVAPTRSLASNGCSAQAGQAPLQWADGAVVSNDLSPTSANWTATPSADSSVPVDAGPGSRIDSPATTSITVPGGPRKWTVAVWAKTDPSSGSYATFVQPAGVPGPLLRTYDLNTDQATHPQVSGYGAPVGSNGWGREMFGQAAVGTWHMFAVTANQTSSLLYVDGVLQSSTAGGDQALSRLTLGSVSPAWRGSLAALSVYPSVLSPAKLVDLATTEAFTCPGGETTGTGDSPSPASRTQARNLVRVVADVVVRAKFGHPQRRAVHVLRAHSSHVPCLAGASRLWAHHHLVVRSTCPYGDSRLKRAVRAMNASAASADTSRHRSRVSALRMVFRHRPNVSVRSLKPQAGPLQSHRALRIRRQGKSMSFTWVGRRLTTAALRRGVALEAARAGVDVTSVRVHGLSRTDLRRLKA